MLGTGYWLRTTSNRELVYSHSASGSAFFHKENEGDHQQDGDGEKPEVVEIGQHGGLPLHGIFDQGVGLLVSKGGARAVCPHSLRSAAQAYAAQRDGPGDILGLSALHERTYRVTAETIGPCAIKSIPRSDFVRFMETHADVSRITALAIAREYNSALLTARRLALSTSAAGKLASALLDWARMDDLDNCPVRSNLPISFLMQLTHEELGSMAGLSRETVSRLLTRFRREGLIDQTHDRMTLIHPDKLQSLYC